MAGSVLFMMLAMPIVGATLAILSEAGPPQMPSLLTKIGPKGSFHIMSEVEVANAKKFIMKEWVSLSTGQTRVDIMQSDERVTYLINGITGERFMYKEYTCTLLKNDFVPQSFLKNYKIEDNEIFKKDPNIFGIGATWMMAKKSRDQTFLKARNAPSLTRPELFNYDMYRLPLNYNPNANKGSDAIDANDIDPGYGLNLFFEPGDFEKPDSERELQIIDWVKKSFDDEPLVRVKIFFFEEQIESHHTELFDLPEGYGCERSPEFSHPLETKFSFKPIDLETPQQMTVDVALMLPYESDQTLWHTQTATVKIITGKMDGMYRYMIVESQQKQLNVQPPEIKRMKNIYDLSNEYHNILYSIDEGTGECKIEKVNDEFGTVIEFTNKISTPTATKLSAPVDVKINIENLNVLFADNDGFHLIKTLDNGVGDLQMLIHERFVEKFEAGSLRGSASIVRKTVVSSPSLVSRSNRPIQQTILTVYVYENAKPTSGGVNTKQETRKRLKAKISLRLYGHADITKQYLHKQLDISDCIDEQKKEYALMKYPLGNPDEARQLANSIDSVYFQFIKTMSLVIGMEPTQLCKIDITFDNYNMFVHMLLVDGPPKHMRYKKTKGKAFNKDSTSGLMIEEIQSSTENCAQSCEFYSCRSFSHCKNSRCTLYIRDTNADETVSDSILTDANCSVYEDDLQVVDHDVSPHKIIARIKDWLKLTEDVEENEDQNQLEADTIKSVSVQGGSSKVKTMAHYLTLHIKLFGIRLAHLTPISIESDLIDEDDLFRDRKFNSAKQLSLQDGQKEVRNQLADKLVQAQYTIEKEGSKFEVPSKDFTYSIMDHLSYQDCATYCQDTDCKSFSYCETEMECVVTKLHKARIIKSHSVKNAHCSIFLRDYLSKFERFPDTPKPDKDAKFVKVKNARECASICMESSDRDCLSFDYCSKRGQCFVYSKHGRTTMVGRTFRIVDKGHDDDPCDHYSRSYLADFDKYLSAHLEIPENAVSLVKKEESSESIESTESSGLLVTGIDTETCAKLCVENDNCSGFTACFDPLSSIKLACNLAYVQLKKSFVKREDHCNTYLLSPKSQFNTPTRQVLPSDPKEAKNELKKSEEALTHTEESEESDVDQQQNIDHSVGWISIFVMLLVGTAVGSGAVWSYKNKERMLEVVQNIRR